MNAYLQKLRLLSSDVRAYLLFKTLETLAVWGIRAILLNLYLLRLGYGTQFIGTFHAVGLLVFAVFGLPANSLGVRWGLRRTLIAGVAIVAVSLGLFPLADLLPVATRTGWLLFTNVGVGAGAALYYVNSTPFLMGATHKEERDHAFSMAAALMPLAAFAGNLAGGALPRLMGTLAGLSQDAPASFRYSLWVAAASFGGGYSISAWGYPVLFIVGAALTSLAALLLGARFCGMPGAHACRPVLGAVEQP